MGAFAGGTGAADPQPLSWRDDPEASLSDWCIIVKAADQPGNVKTFHVHKAMIAAGGRRSEYFVRQCRSGSGASRMAEAARGESTMELEPAAAEAMPIFLDYVYMGSLEATTETGCALVHLANYLLNPALHAAAVDFVDQDLTGRTAPFHLAHAELLSLDKIADAAVVVAAENFHQYKDDEDDHPIANRVPLDHVRWFWALHPQQVVRIVCSSDEKTGRSHITAGADLTSRILAQYVAARISDIDEDFISALFGDEERLLEAIDPSASIELLKLATRFPLLPAAQDLRRRCIKEASEAWDTTLLPLYQGEKRRREEEEADARQRTQRRSKKQKKAAGGSSDPTKDTQPKLPLGAGLPVDVQLELLASMMEKVSENGYDGPSVGLY